ncbi:MAG: bifunctional adenosylcobinamide kinase/adenosylcobinamide-phosphate guanylyltransferase [Clostridium sp.]
MSKITLITGGTRSGKSSFGEGLLKGKNEVLYIATLKVFDEEMKERVKLHREGRNSSWNTLEGHRDLHKEIRNRREKFIMLECIGTMVTNLIFDKYEDVEGLTREEVSILEGEILKEVMEIIKACKEEDKEIIIITNEVGWGLVSEYKLGRIFTDIVGRVNQRVALECDEVYLVACGLPMRLK